jgi:hypothetical protein
MSKLTKEDYVKILNFYKISIPDSLSEIKAQAEKILAEKLCRCIKKVDIADEPKSIGICSRTIFNRKGLRRGEFTCTKKQHVNIRKLKNRKNTKKSNKTKKIKSKN